MKGELQRYVADLLFGQEGVAKEFTTELSLRILDLREQVEQFVEQRLAERRKQLEREPASCRRCCAPRAGKRQEAERAATKRDSPRSTSCAPRWSRCRRAVDQRLAEASPASRG